MEKEKSLLEILMEQKENLVEESLEIVKNIDSYIKENELSELQINYLESLKQLIKNPFIKTIGYSVPQFFVGDLLDYQSYINYFDSLFFENPANTSLGEKRKPGRKKLDQILEQQEEMHKSELSNMTLKEKVVWRYSLTIDVINSYSNKQPVVSALKDLQKIIKKEKEKLDENKKLLKNVKSLTKN